MKVISCLEGMEFLNKVVKKFFQKYESMFLEVSWKNSVAYYVEHMY